MQQLNQLICHTIIKIVQEAGVKPPLYKSLNKDETEFLLAYKSKDKMYNHSIESARMSIQNHQKLSLRQRYTLHRATKEFPQLNNLHPSEYQLPRPRQKNQITNHPNDIHFLNLQKEEPERQQLSCFERVTLSFQPSRPPQLGYQGFYRTPSTTNSLEYQGQKSSKFDQHFVRGEGQGKYSLKNIKKSQGNKSSSRLGIEGLRQQGDERHATDNGSQHLSIDQRITEQRNSQGMNISKYSLKSGAKKSTKPQVLLSLKYSDLASLNGCRSSSLFYQGTHPSRGRIFCTISRSNDKGCKCDPKCFWTNRWLDIVGELPNVQMHQKRSEKEWQDNIKQIQRDLPRTQPEHPSFKSPEMIQMLREVLIGYAQMDTEIGYVQGMNFVAAALVYHCQNSMDALKILYHLMKTCGYRLLFLGDLSMGRMLAKNLSQELRRLVFDLFTHLVEEGIQIELFASSWYFSLCGSFVPLQSMHFILDKFIKKGFTGINEVLITLLLHNKQKLMGLTDSQLMLEFSNQKLCEYGEAVDWQDLFGRSERILLSPIHH